MPFSLFVQWVEDGLTLSTKELKQTKPIPVDELKEQLQKVFLLPLECQDLRTMDGSQAQGVISESAELVLTEVDGPEDALVASQFFLRVRWDEQGVELGRKDVSAPAAGLSSAELKELLEGEFGVPAAAQYLRTMGGDPVGEFEVLMEECGIVMCERFVIKVRPGTRCGVAVPCTRAHPCTAGQLQGGLGCSYAERGRRWAHNTGARHRVRAGRGGAGDRAQALSHHRGVQAPDRGAARPAGGAAARPYSCRSAARHP